jgi:hypothetical protein
MTTKTSTKFIPSQVWTGCQRTGKGYRRLGDAHNAARKHAEWRAGGHPGIGWDGLYEFNMIAGRWFWRETLLKNGRPPAMNTLTR